MDTVYLPSAITVAADEIILFWTWSAYAAVGIYTSTWKVSLGQLHLNIIALIFNLVFLCFLVLDFMTDAKKSHYDALLTSNIVPMYPAFKGIFFICVFECKAAVFLLTSKHHK